MWYSLMKIDDLREIKYHFIRSVYEAKNAYDRFESAVYDIKVEAGLHYPQNSNTDCVGSSEDVSCDLA